MTVNLDEFDNAIRLASAFGGHVVAVDASVLRALVDEVRAARSAADPRPFSYLLDEVCVRGRAGTALREFDHIVEDTVNESGPRQPLPKWARAACDRKAQILAAAAKERTRLEAVVRGDPLALGDAVAEYRVATKAAK